MSGELVAAWAGILITAVLSCFSLWIALRSDRRARETHDLDVHRELTRQASQVSAWIAYLWNPADEENDRANAVLVQNSSPDAIYDLTVTATMKGRESVMSAGVCPPGRFLSRWNPDNRWDLLSDPAEFETRNWLSRPYTRTDQWVVLSVEFTDSTGTRWRRSGAGGITRLPHDLSDLRSPGSIFAILPPPGPAKLWLWSSMKVTDSRGAEPLSLSRVVRRSSSKAKKLPDSVSGNGGPQATQRGAPVRGRSDGLVRPDRHPGPVTAPGQGRRPRASSARQHPHLHPAHHNEGGVTATGHTATDELPAGLTFTTATHGGTYNDTTRVVTWATLPDLAPEQALDVIVTATIDADRHNSQFIDKLTVTPQPSWPPPPSTSPAPTNPPSPAPSPPPRRLRCRTPAVEARAGSR